MNLTNDNDKMEMLNSILDEGESYQGTAIGTILPSAKTLLLFSAIGGGAAGAHARDAELPRSRHGGAAVRAGAARGSLQSRFHLRRLKKPR